MLQLRTAGVDVGKRFVVACVRTPNPVRGRMGAGRRTVRHHRRSHPRSADWLTQHQIEIIALEATSDYWRAVYCPLHDAGLNLMLVSPNAIGATGRFDPIPA